MTCAWVGCPRAAYDHGVCVTHLIDTYAAQGSGLNSPRIVVWML